MLSDAHQRTEALLELIRVTLRRQAPTLTESRAACAERLLQSGTSTSDPARFGTLAPLFLTAWLQLAAAVEHRPESVSLTPPLPPGVLLPSGADPAEIADPALREQAETAVARHQEEIDRWNAKQRALGHLVRLAVLLRASRSAFGEAARDLALAMSLAPGLPPKLRSQLESEAGSAER